MNGVLLHRRRDTCGLTGIGESTEAVMCGSRGVGTIHRMPVRIGLIRTMTATKTAGTTTKDTGIARTTAIITTIMIAITIETMAGTSSAG